MPRGVFRGVNGAMPPPPLGRQDSIISIEWFAYHSILHTIATFGPKSGLNLSEELFFLRSSPNFGLKTGLNLSEDL